MRRTVLASATKFCPSARLGRRSLARSSSWISARPWVTRSVWHPVGAARSMPGAVRRAVTS